MDRAESSQDLADALAPNHPYALVVFQYAACPLLDELAALVNPLLAAHPSLVTCLADPAAIACDDVPTDVLPMARVLSRGEVVAELTGLPAMREGLAAALERARVPVPPKTLNEIFASHQQQAC